MLLQKARIMLTCREEGKYCEFNGILLQPSPGKYEVDVKPDDCAGSFDIFLEGIERDNIDDIYVILFGTEEKRVEVSSYGSDRKDNERITTNREMLSFIYSRDTNPKPTLKDISNSINSNLNR
jgi:hypothetical protein